jgi:hypothetical protein
LERPQSSGSFPSLHGVVAESPSQVRPPGMFPLTRLCPGYHSWVCAIGDSSNTVASKYADRVQEDSRRGHASTVSADPLTVANSSPSGNRVVILGIFEFF